MNNMQINELLSYFNNVKRVNNNSYQCNCPAHRDSKPSLTISEKGDKILMYCHAGCSNDMILNAVGLKIHDLYNNENVKKTTATTWKTKLEGWKKKELEAVYHYYDENTLYLYSKMRFKGKEIIYGILDRVNDKMLVGLKNNVNNKELNVKKVLYNLPAVVQSKESDSPVFFVEGEKDVDTLTKLGYIATTCGGVSDWRQSFAKYFKGKSVIILPDNDSQGRNLSEIVFEDIKKYAFQIKIVNTSDQPKGDVTDYLTIEKHTKFEFDNLIQKQPWIMAPYVYKNKSDELRINADLLSYFVGSANKHLILTKRGIEKELLYIYEAGVYREHSKAQFKNVIRSYLPKGMANDNLLNNTLNLFLCSDDKFYDFDDINTKEDIINVKNGIYNVKTKAFYPHSSEIFSTLQLNCNHFPEKVKSPVKWLKFIDELCTNQEGVVDQDMIKILQEQTGLILSNYPVYRTKKAFILYSPIGNTGKSVYLNIINEIIGKENVTNIPMQKMADRFSLGDIHGKRIISIGDQTSEDIKDCSIFKQLTGGDYVQAELKGKQSFSFIFTGGIMIACNNLPYFADDKGNHVFDRLLILPCTNVIPAHKRNKQLTIELLEEKDDIFNWALEGLHRLLNNNFNFTHCEAVEQAIIDYRNNIDTLFHFINSECIVTDDKTDRIRKKIFEDRYISWCEQNDYTPISKKNIKERAMRIGHPLVKYYGDFCYQNITFKPKDHPTFENQKLPFC